MFLLKKAILATQCHCLNTLPVSPLFIRKCFSLMFEGQVFIFVMAKVLFLLQLFYFLCTELITLVVL